MDHQQLDTKKQETARPKRRATNAHVFRYLQTRNPSRLEENDLKRALEASLEECPDFWPEDSASCSSSEQSNAPSATSSSSTSSLLSCGLASSSSRQRVGRNKSTSKRTTKSMQLNHLSNCHLHSNHNNHSLHSSRNHQFTANSNHCSCPISSVHNRYKPVAKKNIYNEADFFHDGIMAYIDYELNMIRSKRMGKAANDSKQVESFPSTNILSE